MVLLRLSRPAARAGCLAAFVGLSLAAISGQTPPAPASAQPTTPPSQAPASQTPPGTPDIGKAYVAPRAGDDYERREVMIPMRDGVKLFVAVFAPGALHQNPTHGLGSGGKEMCTVLPVLGVATEQTQPGLMN